MALQEVLVHERSEQGHYILCYRNAML